MKATLIQQRAQISERQRLAGVRLADSIRLQGASTNLFDTCALGEIIRSLLDKIEDYTQQLLEIDARIAECEEEVLIDTDSKTIDL